MLYNNVKPPGASNGEQEYAMLACYLQRDRGRCFHGLHKATVTKTDSISARQITQDKNRRRKKAFKRRNHVFEDAQKNVQISNLSWFDIHLGPFSKANLEIMDVFNSHASHNCA